MRLRLVNLTKRFFSLRGEVVAVDNVNLEIKNKEFFVFLGPSGCGKSTLLNLIAGLERPTRGEIFFDDRLVASRAKRVFFTPRERNVAFVFQSYALYPHLNVFENIAFPLRIKGENREEVNEAVRRVASLLEISELLPAKPKELSGGQRQRVAIARAIVRKPNIFLLDEPLSNLDAQLRASMRMELKKIQNRLGITTVYVTHDQIEAMSLGDRVALLNEGKIEEVGTPYELYHNPSGIFVARFIGSPPMNLIKASFSRENDNFFIIMGSKIIAVPEEKREDLKKLKRPSFILGIRPEHIHISPEKTASSLRVKVISMERLGKENLLYVDFEGNKISLFTHLEGIGDREILDIEFDFKKIHIFKD